MLRLGASSIWNVHTRRLCVCESLASRQGRGILNTVLRVITANTHNANGRANTLTTSACAQSDLPYLASLKARGVYNLNLFKHVDSFGVKDLATSDDGKYLNITWDDGHVSKFHALWLRHNCHCADCKIDFNSMVKINFIDIDTALRVTSARLEGESVVVLTWQSPTGEKFHEGPIPTHWLRHYCYSKQACQRRSQQRAMNFHVEKRIPEIEYEEVIGSDYGLYKWLNELSERGICLLKNVPPVKGMLPKITERIAPIQHTVYGETFDVVSTPQPINAAYSTVALDLHMDQIHYESPPGLQMLHCIEFDPHIEGGDNTFADIHELAHKLREERPDYFDILVRVPVPMQTIHYARDYPVHLEFERPLFTLNNRKELVSVVWHPMLIGPLQIPEEDIEPFYEAYKYFFAMVKSNTDLYKLRLVEGDLISFNNRRILHGRSAYSNQQGVRAFQGTYVELSEFQSRVQVLHNTLGDGRLAMRPGSFNNQ